MFPIGTEPRQQQTTRLELLLDQRRSRKRECFTSVIHAHGHLPRCKLHYSIKAAAENVRCVCRLHTVPLPRCIFRKARSSWNGPPPMLPRIFSRRSCSFSAMVRSGTFSDAALTFACDASEQNRKRGAGNRPATSPLGDLRLCAGACVPRGVHDRRLLLSSEHGTRATALVFLVARNVGFRPRNNVSEKDEATTKTKAAID